MKRHLFHDWAVAVEMGIYGAIVHVDVGVELELHVAFAHGMGASVDGGAEPALEQALEWI